MRTINGYVGFTDMSLTISKKIDKTNINNKREYCE